MSSTSISDLDLLRAHQAGDAEAFTLLVRRHVDWIYGVARRRVGGDAQLAEDVTQATFLTLAKRAASLGPTVVLPAWLFRVACYVASSVRRERSRRSTHEQARSRMVANRDAGTFDASVEWQALAPIVDELIARLRQCDREAIVLRFYRQMSHAEVGEALRISEEAARKRTARALDQLRTLMERRGVTIGAASGLAIALSQGLASNATAAAPAGVVTVVTTAAHAGTATSAAMVNQAALLAGRWATRSWAFKLAAAVAVGGAAIGAGVVAASRFHTAVAVPPVAAMVNGAQPGGESPAIAPATTPAEEEPLWGNSREIHEVGGQLKMISMVMNAHIRRGKNERLPHTLGGLLTTLVSLQDNDVQVRTREAAKIFILKADHEKIPEQPTPAWIDANTPFVYLAADVDPRELGGKLMGTTIFVHTPLNAPLEHAEMGAVILAFFGDGHGEIVPLKDAKKRIALSQDVLTDLRRTP